MILQKIHCSKQCKELLQKDIWISQALLVNFLEGKIVFMGEIPEIPPETQLAGCTTLISCVFIITNVKF